MIWWYLSGMSYRQDSRVVCFRPADAGRACLLPNPNERGLNVVSQQVMDRLSADQASLTTSLCCRVRRRETPQARAVLETAGGDFGDEPRAGASWGARASGPERSWEGRPGGQKTGKGGRRSKQKLPRCVGGGVTE